MNGGILVSVYNSMFPKFHTVYTPFYKRKQSLALKIQIHLVICKYNHENI